MMRNRTLYLKYRDKILAQHRQYRKSLAGKATDRRHKYKVRYGITIEQYDGMVTKQNGKCAICEHSCRLVIDHDHLTNKVRGLLCHRCNSLMEVFDKRELEDRLRKYKEEYGN